MLFRALLLLSFIVSYSQSLAAQSRADRFLIPATRMSVQIAGSGLYSRVNDTKLHSQDGRSWIHFTVFAAGQETLFRQSVMGTLPDGPRNRISLLGGKAEVEWMQDHRISGVLTYRYAGGVRLADGRLLGIAASVFTDGLVSKEMVENVVRSLRLEEEPAGIFHNKSYSFDVSRLTLRHCQDETRTNWTVFTADGQCAGEREGVSRVMISVTHHSGRRGSGVASILGDDYYKYQAGSLATIIPRTFWSRYISFSTAPAPTVVVYRMVYDQQEYIVQATLTDGHLMLAELDQFVATFRPQ